MDAVRRQVNYVDDVKPMIEDNLYRVPGVEGVLWAVPLYKVNARAKLTFLDRVTGEQRPVIEQVILFGLDDVSLIGIPRHLYIGRPANLWKPDEYIVGKVGPQGSSPAKEVNMAGPTKNSSGSSAASWR